LPTRFAYQRLEHDADYNKVSQKVKSLGIDGAMFMFMGGEENEDFIRFLRT